MFNSVPHTTWQDLFHNKLLDCIRYECVSNATFDGVNTTLTYQLRVPRAVSIATDEDLELPETLTITYR